MEIGDANSCNFADKQAANQTASSKLYTQNENGLTKYSR